MGRKPNALLLQHFERGEKLNDNSNRYHQTCKACNEQFPKGRSDSMIQHLTKKCTALPPHIREQARLELEGNKVQRSQNGSSQMNGQSAGLPTMTPLEALVQVSTTQLGANGYDNGNPVQRARSTGEHRASEPRGDRFQIQEHYTPDNPPLSYEQRVQRDKNYSELKHTQWPHGSPQPSRFHPDMGTSRPVSPHSTMAPASIAQVAAEAARFVPAMVDPALLAEQSHEGHDDHQHENQREKSLEQALNENAAYNQNFLAQGPNEQQLSWVFDGPNQYMETENIDQGMSAATGSNGYSQMTPPAAMTTTFAADYGNGQRGPRPRVRGKFDPERRKEISEIRKIGACIRCHMLRKPCGGGNPCELCSKIENARVWTFGCIRTQVEDIFEIFSAGLHVVLAYNSVNAAKNRISFTASAQQISASHHPESATLASSESANFASFRALQAQDPQLNNQIVYMLDSDNIDFPSKLDTYIEKVASTFFEREASHFMQVTLNAAIAREEKLVKLSLKLWSFVHILVDQDAAWAMFRRDCANGANQRVMIDQHDPTYSLVAHQLNAAVEKKVALLLKQILAPIKRDRRKKNDIQPFDKFLAGMICLNCIEKSIWLLESWEQPSFRPRWPLEKSPRHYIEQGDKLTTILPFVLMHRFSAPKTFTRSDGVVAVKMDDDSIASNPDIDGYYNTLNLSYVDLINRSTGFYQFNPADSRCFEMRFCSRLLLIKHQ